LNNSRPADEVSSCAGKDFAVVFSDSSWGVGEGDGKTVVSALSCAGAGEGLGFCPAMQ
jgi:hypothetical protein